VRLLLALAASILAAPLRAEELAYAPPVAPPPPDPTSLLLRLAGLTAFTLAVCGALIWLVRRGTRAAHGPTSDRLVLLGGLPLHGRSSVHLLKVDGQEVAVTTDATGIRSIVVLSAPFDDVLAETLTVEPDRRF
jgi:flagellar biogenesis protein FliO